MKLEFVILFPFPHLIQNNISPPSHALQRSNSQQASSNLSTVGNIWLKPLSLVLLITSKSKKELPKILLVLYSLNAFLGGFKFGICQLESIITGGVEDEINFDSSDGVSRSGTFDVEVDDTRERRVNRDGRMGDIDLVNNILKEELVAKLWSREVE